MTHSEHACCSPTADHGETDAGHTEPVMAARAADLAPVTADDSMIRIGRDVRDGKRTLRRLS